MANQIADIYWDMSAEGHPVRLDTFLDDVLEDKYASKGVSSVSKADIAAFLDQVEDVMLENIEVKVNEAPQFAAMKTQTIEATQAEIQELRDRYVKV